MTTIDLPASSVWEHIGAIRVSAPGSPEREYWDALAPSERRYLRGVRVNGHQLIGSNGAGVPIDKHAAAMGLTVDEAWAAIHSWARNRARLERLERGENVAEWTRDELADDDVANLEPAAFMGGDVLDHLGAAGIAMARAEINLNAAVASARNAGASWGDIGAALGLSRQSCHQRWGK